MQLISEEVKGQLPTESSERFRTSLHIPSFNSENILHNDMFALQ
jgi:hypothetical protein